MSTRKNFGAKPLLFPLPVLIIGTYDENGKANAMNAAWGGIVGMDEIIIDLSHHKTTENLLVTKAFTVSGRCGAHDCLRLCGAYIRQQGAGENGESRLYHDKKQLCQCADYQ